ncbi:MAG: hypothetical protein AAF050_00590 [Cyanobacteria bacterium J06649_5]
MSNNNGLHTTDAEKETPISYEESISIAGVPPDETDEELLPPDKLLETNTRRIESSPIPRSVLVFGTLGALFLGWVVLSNFGGKETQFAETENTQEEIAVEPNESDAFRSQLALVDQQSDSNQTQNTEGEATLEEKSVEVTATPVSTAPPPASTPPAPRPTPAAPPAPSRSEPSRTESPAAIQPPEPEVDPFEQWTKLAMAGTSGTDLAVVEQTRQVANRGSSQRAYAADNSTNFPVATIGERSLVISPRATFAAWRTTEASRPPVDVQPSDVEPAEAESVEPEPDLLQELRDGQLQRTGPAQSEQASEIERPVENSPVALARSRESAGNPEAGELDNASLEVAQDRQLSVGAQGILNRASSSVQNYPQVHQITTGTSAAATVVVPMVYSPDSGSDNTHFSERFAVTLKEPLVDINGTPALSEGTVLITEIESVSVQSQVVSQAVVAIVYEDQNGNMRQEMIERGVLSIRGKNNTPLIAELSNDQDAVSQDLMIGLSSALGNIGRTINSGNVTSTSSSGTNSSSATTVFSNGDRNILAAALEGFFGATTERMQQRLEPDGDDRLPVLVVPEGEEVSVFVNGLLNVNR